MPSKKTPPKATPKAAPKATPKGPSDTDKGLDASQELKKKRAAAKKSGKEANALNFMIFCDGTGDNALDEDRPKTNVHRLFKCVANLEPGKAGGAAVTEEEEPADDAESEIEFAGDEVAESVDLPATAQSPRVQDRPQVAIYQQGIGTVPEINGLIPGGLDEAEYAKAQKALENAPKPSGLLTDQAFGRGLEANIAVLYYIICTGWTPGDKLYLFGFSRGAYTVRLLAALLLDIGVIDFRRKDLPKNLNLVENKMLLCGKMVKKWGKYQNDVFTKGKNVPLVKHQFITVPSIEVLGLWDCVGSAGNTGEGLVGPRDIWAWGSKWKFAEELRDGVENAFHALALTERRRFFKPVPFETIPKNGKQCWFVGPHSVVGGNQKHPEINIGDLTLIWMVSQLRDLMGIDEKQLTKTLSTSEPGAESIAESKKGPSGLGFEHLRGRYVGLGDRDFVHQSVRLFTPLTNISEIGPVLPKILAGKATKVGGGYSWKTREGNRVVKEDKPSPFESAKLKKIKVYIEGSGAAFLAAEGDKPLEPAAEDEDLEEEVLVDEKPSKKTPSGKRLKKTPAASTARGAADNPKATALRPHKEAKYKQ